MLPIGLGMLKTGRLNPLGLVAGGNLRTRRASCDAQEGLRNRRQAQRLGVVKSDGTQRIFAIRLLVRAQDLSVNYMVSVESMCKTLDIKRNGVLEKATWEEAMSLVAGKFKR